MRVSRDMLISDVLASCPGAATVFESHHLPCGGCLASSMETIEAIAVVHDVSVDALIAELNALGEGDCAAEESSR